MGAASAPPAGGAPHISTPGDGGSPTVACSALTELAATIPQLAELRRAASAPSISRFTSAVTTLMSQARVVFAAGLMAARRRTLVLHGPVSATLDAQFAAATVRGALMHEAMLKMSALCLSDFSEWKWTPTIFHRFQSQLSQLVALRLDTTPCQPPMLTGGAQTEDGAPFPYVPGLFLAALASGWPWSTALHAFTFLHSGIFADSNRLFTASIGSSHRDGVWSHGVLRLIGQAHCLQVYLFNGCVTRVQSSRPLLSVRHMLPPTLPALQEQSPALPSFLRLAVDKKSGLSVLPLARVTTIVERQAVWHKILGSIDGATAAILAGHLAYPRDCWDWEPLFCANHPSWEKDREAKKALGPTIAAWIHSGILEWVPPSCPAPLIVEPLGAVEKSTQPYYRLISDARRSNKCLSKWSVRCMNLLDMAAALDYGAKMSGDDVNDAYHLSPFGGCSGELVEELGLSCGLDGVWKEVLRLHVGCSPRTCLGTCDKARSGCCIDGFLFRFAATHFGQKLAGSPLNCLLMTVLRHLLRRAQKASPGLLLLCFLWVDDLILARNVAPHGPCGGLASECSVCAAALAEFEQFRRYWHKLADTLGISLSTAKRQEPGQRIEYTGVIVDTVAGRLFIPETKLEKLRKCLTSLIAAPDCSTREILSVRGRVRHYSLCINYVRPLVPRLALRMRTWIGWT